MYSLKNQKVCLVTGARTGIGKSISELFAKNGYKVIMAGKNENDCKMTATSLIDMGYEVSHIELDLSKTSVIEDKVLEAKEIWGKLDLVVNNAATVEPIAMLGNVNQQELEKACKINFLGPLFLINSCWDYLKETKGKVLNILSGAAMNPVEGWAAYCSTKSALHMINQQVHLEGMQYDIKSIGISPGMIDTEMQKKIRDSGINRISKVKQSDLIPKEVPARFSLWCASDDANDLSGQMISLNDPSIRKKYQKWDAETNIRQ